MIFKNFKKNFYIKLTILTSIFLLDRITKLYVINLNDIFLNTEIYTSKFLNISLIWNNGIAFGLFSFNESYIYNLITIVILIVIIFVFVMIINNDGIKHYSLLIIFSGAIGNLYDRIFYRAVPDFIDFHIGNFHFFIFNVADIFITLGVFFMIFFELIGNNKEKYEKI
jgi:signal peptidase II